MIGVPGQLGGRLLATSAVLSVVCSAGWTWSQRGGLEAIRRTTRQPEFRAENQLVTPPRAERPLSAVRWTAPTAGGDGGRATALFARPSGPGRPGDAEVVARAPGQPRSQEADVADVELIAVVREPYFVQLAGYVGAPGDYVVAFRQSDNEQALLGRVGERLGDTGLMLTNFSVGQVTVSKGDSEESDEVLARATVREDRDGSVVELTDREPALSRRGRAVVRIGGGAGQVSELGAGGTIDVGETRWKLERVQLEPPEVELSRWTVGNRATEVQVLRPAATRMADSRPSGP